jgi:hypothetical protein
VEISCRAVEKNDFNLDSKSRNVEYADANGFIHSLIYLTEPALDGRFGVALGVENVVKRWSRRMIAGKKLFL